MTEKIKYKTTNNVQGSFPTIMAFLQSTLYANKSFTHVEFDEIIHFSTFNDSNKPLFNGFTSLQSVTFNKEVDQLPDNLFNGCTNLTTVSIGISNKILDAINSSNITNALTEEEYTSSPILTSNDYTITGINLIGKNCFKNCVKLTTLNIYAVDNITVNETNSTDKPFSGVTNKLTFNFFLPPNVLNRNNQYFPIIFKDKSKLGLQDYDINVKIPYNFIKVLVSTNPGKYLLSDSMDNGPCFYNKIYGFMLKNNDSGYSNELNNYINKVSSYSTTSIPTSVLTNITRINTFTVGRINDTSGNLISLQGISGETNLTFKPKTITLSGNGPTIDAYDRIENTTIITQNLDVTKLPLIEPIFNRKDIAIGVYNIKASYIPYGFFRSSALLQEVNLNNVTLLNNRIDGLFIDCSNLTSVTLSDSITILGIRCFKGCTSLSSISNNNIVKIDNECFAFCNNLTSVSFPKLNYIGDKGFYDCIRLNSFNNKQISVTSVANVTSLSNVSSLTDVTYIGSSAFAFCENITNFDMPNNRFLGSNVFNFCKKLTKITLSNNITNIGNSAFADCIQLKDFIISSKISNLMSHCFKNCVELTKITVSNNLLSIGFGCFYNCNKLSSIIVDGINDVNNFNKDNNINLPHLMTIIKDKCFYGCENITNIIIPNNISKIGIAAFENCKNLKEIKTYNYDINATPEYTFYTNQLPLNLVEISNFCFNGCENLTKIILQNKVIHLIDDCFKGCINLTSISLNNGIISLGKRAFYGCYKLSEINLPNSLEIIDNYCFAGCTEIISLNIPSSVNYLGKLCFSSSIFELSSGFVEILDNTYANNHPSKLSLITFNLGTTNNISRIMNIQINSTGNKSLFDGDYNTNGCTIKFMGVANENSLSLNVFDIYATIVKMYGNKFTYIYDTQSG